jgi:uncharacterized protein YidB (DUF937 family)
MKSIPERRCEVRAPRGVSQWKEVTTMGVLDKVGGALKGALDKVEALSPGLISSTLANTKFGNLSGLVAQLQQGGLDAQVKSWLSSGANLPVSAEQIRSALGNQKVKDLAAQFGLPVDATLDLLAQQLPTVVDRASPDGKLPSD